jgi:HD domain
MKPVHLARRFLRALWPGRPRAQDVAWVATVLEPNELALWRELPRHDQRYTIRVAKLAEERLAGTEFAGQQRWLAAALLHDVGKLDAGLGVMGRSVATVLGAVASRGRVDRWAQASGFRRRVAWYLHHDERGADRIRAAGGRDEAARWARAHHHRDRWPESGVPIAVAETLEAADNA